MKPLRTSLPGSAAWGAGMATVFDSVKVAGIRFVPRQFDLAADPCLFARTGQAAE